MENKITEDKEHVKHSIASPHQRRGFSSTETQREEKTFGSHSQFATELVNNSFGVKRTKRRGQQHMKQKRVRLPHIQI